jgi:FkbM family methyltransferase
MEIQTITGGSQFYRPATLLNIGKARRARTVVPVRSLSSLMNEWAHEEIAVLKIDIEGSEYGLFESWPANWAPA